MQLYNYPEKIAKLRRIILEYNQEIGRYTELCRMSEFKAKIEVSNNSTLKNETQRKAKELEILENDLEYQGYRNELRDLNYLVDRHTIDLNLLVDQFSVCKIIKRAEIARIQQISTGLIPE